MDSITIVEVGTRDGFQPIATFIPTAKKVAIIRALHACGLKRVEATAFVSTKAVPQLSDAPAVLREIADLPGLETQVLAPTAKYAQLAFDAGAHRIAFVLSASCKHNRNNVKRTPLESCDEYLRMREVLPPDHPIRLNIATAFDCPFDGPVPMADVLAILERIWSPQVEVGLCDTTGRVTPDVVEKRFREVMDAFPGGQWAFHGHDTYGLGVANVLAAARAGVRVIDASVGGLGGCPFAPGATGNVATEDVVWTLERMGWRTGVDLARLAAVAWDVITLEGAQPGGRVRKALNSALCHVQQS